MKVTQLSKRYERVIELLRFVQPEIASAASFTLLSTRHQLERLQRSKRDCESNACEDRAREDEMFLVLRFVFDLGFHAVLRKISHLESKEQRELSNLRHILDSGSSSVVRRCRQAIRQLAKTHKNMAVEATRRLDKLVRKVRKSFCVEEGDDWLIDSKRFGVCGERNGVLDVETMLPV